MSWIHIVYDGPMHQTVIAPSNEDIREILFDTDEQYWLSGSGEGEFTYRNEDVVARICIKRVIGIGVRMFFIDEKDGEFLVSINRTRSLDDVVSVFSGGMFHVEPESLYFDEKIACEAVRNFCETGKRPRIIQWEKWTELEWDGQDE